MRRYLGERERGEYAALPALAQAHWLLGRIAIKDAVRAWLWERGAGPLYPMEVQVGSDDPNDYGEAAAKGGGGVVGRGEPVVVGPGGVRPHVSLSLLDGEAVVVVDEHALQST